MGGVLIYHFKWYVSWENDHQPGDFAVTFIVGDALKTTPAAYFGSQMLHTMEVGHPQWGSYNVFQDVSGVRR